MIHIALLLHSGDPGPGVCQGPNRLLYVWDPETMRYRFIDNFPIKVGINMICIYIYIYKYNLTICNYIYIIYWILASPIHMYIYGLLWVYTYIHMYTCSPKSSPFSSLNNTMSRRFQTQDYDMIFTKRPVKTATFWDIPDLHPYLLRLPRSTPHAS